MDQPDLPPSVSAKRSLPEDFWTVGTTAMTRAEAEEAAEFIARRFTEVHAFAVNPRSSLLLGLDRWTAEVVREALVRYTGPGRDVASLVEDIDGFLTYGDPYDPDEDRPRLED
jgi:hypothetical protein